MKQTEPRGRVKQTMIREHISNCWAAAKYGGDWVMEEIKGFKRDRTHRRNGRTWNRFVLFRCNDAACGAQMIALEYDVMRASKIDGRTAGENLSHE